MDKKYGVWIAVGVVVAGVIIYAVMSGGATPAGTNQQTGATNNGSTTADMGQGQPAAPVNAVPQQSEPLKAGQAVPAAAVKITASAAGFSPSTFTVSEGAKVTIALISGDQFAHVFMFDDPALSNFAVGISPGETRTIEFTAPKAGTYTFQDTVPGHAARGETGSMTVR
jgi:uncharacterized cupredoxin-like copper-binding protein